MKNVAYRNWGFIPVDDDVTAGDPTITRPPMLGNLALDRGTSLVLELASCPAKLRLSISATAVSAPGTDPGLSLLAAQTRGAYRPIEHTAWETQYEGSLAVLSCEVSDPSTLLKIHHTHPKSLIITRVECSEGISE